MLVTHGTGSVIAYDVLWQLSHDEELKSAYGDRKVELWLTLGSPLGDRNVQRRLLGAGEKSAGRRAPARLRVRFHARSVVHFDLPPDHRIDEFIVEVTELLSRVRSAA